MQIKCPKCERRFSITAHRLPPEGLIVPCEHCGHGLRLRPRPAWEPGRSGRPHRPDGPEPASEFETSPLRMPRTGYTPGPERPLVTPVTPGPAADAALAAARARPASGTPGRQARRALALALLAAALVAAGWFARGLLAATADDSPLANEPNLRQVEGPPPQPNDAAGGP